MSELLPEPHSPVIAIVSGALVFSLPPQREDQSAAHDCDHRRVGLGQELAHESREIGSCALRLPPRLVQRLASPERGTPSRVPPPGRSHAGGASMVASRKRAFPRPANLDSRLQAPSVAALPRALPPL